MLSTILLVPVADVVQGVIAVLAVLIFVAGFAIGLGAGKFYTAPFAQNVVTTQI